MDLTKGSGDQDESKQENDINVKSVEDSDMDNSSKEYFNVSANNSQNQEPKIEGSDTAEIIDNNHCAIKGSISDIAVESNNSNSGFHSSISCTDGATGYNCSDASVRDIQNDSALSASPKSLFSIMDTSCDKTFDTNTDEANNEHKVELSNEVGTNRQDDSGICVEKPELDNSLRTEDIILESNDTSTHKDNAQNLVSENNCKASEVKIECESSCSSITKDTLITGDNNQSCDTNTDTKVLDSDDLSGEDISDKINKDSEKLKSSVLDSDDNSDTSGPSNYQVSACKETDKKSDSSSNNSDIEQEMDALDIFLSQRKRRHESGQSNSSNDNDVEGSRSAAVHEDDDQDETKSESDHSDAEDSDYDLTPPHDPWSPLKEMRAREIGFGNKLDAPHRFRSRCGSSVRFTQKLKRLCKLEHHEGCVNALHFNKAGTLLASGSDDLNVVVWDWLNCKPYFDFDSGHRSNVFQCKFMPYTGDSHIVSCARDGQIRLAELSSTGMCKGTKKLAQHRGAAHKLALLEDSSHVFYSCGEDAVVYEIDLRQDKPNKLCTTKEKDKKIPLYSIHSNPLKSFEYCVGGRDHYLRVYDKRMVDGDGSGDNVLKKYCPHHLVDSDIKANVTCAVYNWDGQEVLGTYNDEDIYLFDNTHSDGAEYIHKYTGHRNNATVKGVNFYGPKSEFVVSGSDCGNVYLWDKKSEKIVNYFHADDGGVVNVLEPHPHMPVLATSGLDHDVKIWMPMGCEITKMDGLAKRIKKNHKERERERMSEPEMLDGRMLWFLMRHLRRTRRRPGDNGDSSTDSDDVERGDSGHSDNDDDEPMQCMPS